MRKFNTIQNGYRKIKGLISVLLLLSNTSFGQTTNLKLYPFSYEFMPETESPAFINDTDETILIVIKDSKYALAPVTVENGKPLLYSYKVGTYMGKDQQLFIDKGDFPDLAKTGLHSEDKLKDIKIITGIPTETINCTGRPNSYSTTGFMAEDEDLISIIKNDNKTVRKLGFTHAQLAKPLFHIWNLILLEYELGNWARFYDNIKNIYYNDNILNFQASGSKGWQISIFMDEIQGRHNIHIDRELTPEEEKYLIENYSFLGPEKLKDLKYRISNLDFSEMLPYYIMRYGFYEGHSEYRTDPISISFIFGLLSIDEIDKRTGGKLYNSLTDHFVLKSEY
jgi:hypothetical protein